jgi:ABC-2 type transport system ATP-binding protein
MLKLVREIGESGVRIIFSSHLLRDVESVCDEVIVLREGQVATIANLAAERESHRRFLEVETRGADPAPFVAALSERGCDVAELQNRRLKIVLPESVAQRELWRLAEASGLQLRRLTVAKNSLEHLFLRAMEENGVSDVGDMRSEAPRAGL